MKQKAEIVKISLKLIIVGLSLAGFITQTVQFLFYYWTYPTVMDIQESIPLETDIPAITFCTINGFNPVLACKMKAVCFPYMILVYARQMCDAFPVICMDNGGPPKDFTLVAMSRFLKEHDLDSSTLQRLKTPVKKLLNCKIVQGVTDTDCDLDDVQIASYFSTSTIMNTCYTINSLWKNPTKKIKKIGKYGKIVLEFFVDVSGKGRIDDIEKVQMPTTTMPSTNANIQLAVHSPYTMVSPFISGAGFLGGKQYKIKLQREDKHLLPPPYQTNCTDYMQTWHENGGVGPLNQIMALEECKFRNALERRNCVPFTIDYPHNETICKNCPTCKEEIAEMAEIADNCSEEVRSYNQPCDFTTYKMSINEKMIFVEKELTYLDTGEKENLVLTQKGHECSRHFADSFKVKCALVNIEIVFDDLLVTNITYNPKVEIWRYIAIFDYLGTLTPILDHVTLTSVTHFCYTIFLMQSLQLFSMIGGYMGLYLGVSFAAMYDLVEVFLVKLYGFWQSKPNGVNRKLRKNKVFVSRLKGDGSFRRRSFIASPKQSW